MNKSIPFSTLAPKDLSRVIRSNLNLEKRLEALAIKHDACLAKKQLFERERIEKLIEENNLIHFL